MFQAWRQELSAAQESVRNGLLEEAARLLTQPRLREFRPAKRLLAQVSLQLAERAKRKLALGQSLAGWRDLQLALEYGGETPGMLQLQQDFLRRRMDEAQKLLWGGNPLEARQRLANLPTENGSSGELFRLRKLAGYLLEASQYAQRGDFGRSEQILGEARAFVEKKNEQESKNLLRLEEEYRVKKEKYRRQATYLHAGLEREDWNEVLAAAESVLELCPDHEPARGARRRAWEKVGMRSNSLVGDRIAAPAFVPRNRILQKLMEKPGMLPEEPRQPNPHSAEETGREQNRRYMLWIDGVGGFLICQGKRILIGQPHGSEVDIPILADLSSRHARLSREGENYLVEPIREVRLAGKALDRMTSLSATAELELGKNVRLRFRRPHPYSASVRLDLVSSHRTQPSVDGILWLADTLILGPGENSHVVCRNWPQEIVLFAREEQLFIRINGAWELDGRTVEGTQALGSVATIRGEGFGLSLEPWS